MVCGILGNKRISLRACAYTAIRKQFPVSKDETFTGFDLDEENFNIISTFFINDLLTLDI